MRLDAANLTTLARVPLAFAIWVRPKDRRWVLSLLLAAGATDLLDGWLARRDPLHSRSTGAWLDPLCDKVFALSALAAVHHAQPRRSRRIAALIAAREILQAPLLSAYLVTRPDWARPRYTAIRLGKLATLAQFLAMATLVLRNRMAVPLAVAAAGLGSAAAGVYFKRSLIGTAVTPPARRRCLPRSDSSDCEDPSEVPQSVAS